MTRDAFEFMRQHIHFAENDRQKKKWQVGYDPLFKVREIMDKMMQRMRRAWTAGKHVTIDESMIKYMGRAISFVQYMPLKPIKHGIKVFCVCCAFTAFLLGFEVYLGKENIHCNEDRSVLGIVDRLIVENGLTSARGRVLYTDNWYTSVDLAKHLYEKYGWTIVGTMSATDKKERKDHDIPFLKLSNGALMSVKRGWFREATLEMKTRNGRRYVIKCTTWRDKKQVTFLHTHVVGPSVGYTVKRHVKGKSRRVELKGPRVQNDYINHFNAIDINDRNSAEHTVSVRTNRWYLRMFFWLLDRVVFSCYIIVVFLADSQIGDPSWKVYKNKKWG